MPTPLPDGWPAPSPVQTLPGVYVTLPDLGTMAVGSWSLERELQGALLPGNVRAASGISIGSGTVSVAGVTPDGKVRSPWSKTARVNPGGVAKWFTSYDGPDSDNTVPLGDWQLSPYSGSLASPASMSVDLVERQYAGTSSPNVVDGSDFYGADPIYLVDQLARQIGYYSTPKPTSSCILSVPFAGGIWVEVGVDDYYQTAELTGGAPLSWASVNGRITMTGGLALVASCAGPLLNSSNEAYITLDSSGGEIDFEFGDARNDVSMLPTIGVNSAEGEIYAAAAGTTGVSTVSFAPGLDPDQPNRVQLHVKRIGSPGAWTAVWLRARSSETAPWSAWAIASADSTVDTTSALTLIVSVSATISALTINSSDEPSVWDSGNAHLELLGGMIATPWIDGTLDTWTAIQQVVAAWAGAAWATTSGSLAVRNRDGMAGVGALPTPVDVGTSVEDIPWSTDPADTADRLELTYWPVDGVNLAESPSTYGPIAWSAEDAIELPPGKTTVVTADVDGYFEPLPEEIDGFSSWTPAWNDSSLYPNWFSVYGACTTRDGTGTHPDYNVIGFRTVQVSTGRVEIHITNPTSSTLYTVDANGNPCLFLTCNGVYRQNTSSTTERGASAADAENTLTIDLGRYVQNSADAEALADYIWGRVSTPSWKASSVHVALDWSRDIGDVVTLTHESSELSQKAIVTGISYDGAPGQVSQTLDLVLLPPTWADFDAAWASRTWGDFDAEWAADSWDDFDDDPLRSS